MPLGGLIPYADETMRRRRLPAPFTPEPPLPDMREAPLPEFTPRPITRSEELSGAREEFVARPQSRLKSIGLGALRGLGQGLSSGQGLGAGLGGALAGGLFGGLDPRGLREQAFEEYKKPRILERFAMEDAEAQRQQEAQDRQMRSALMGAQIANLNRQNLPRPLAPPRPLVVAPGGTAINPETGQPIFTAPAAPREPRPPTAAELTIEPSSGKSFEEIAEDSYQARGGDKYVFDRLPVRTRQLLSGEIEDADPQEIARAQQAFEDAITRQRKTDLDYTRGSVRSRALGARRGGQSKPSQSGISRPRSQFNSKKYPGLKFD